MDKESALATATDTPIKQRTPLPASLKRYQRSKFIPIIFEWNGVFENWSRKFVKRNFWRVAAIFQTEEDALQECAAIFIKCRNRYIGRVVEARHMMALYQTALNRSWNTFSSRDPHFRVVFAEREEMSIDEPETAWDMKLSKLLSEVDAELKVAIIAIIEAPDEFLSIIFKGDDTKKITNRLSRMFGIRAGDRDLVVELRSLLLESGY